MKIFGIIIIVICLAINVTIGLFLFGSYLGADDIVSSQPESTVTIDDGVLPYKDTTTGISFEYPKAWPRVTTAEDRRNDSRLVDIFASQDGSDLFREGLFVSIDYANDTTLIRLVDELKNNLISNGYSLNQESDTIINGRKVHVLELSGNEKTDDGKAEFNIRGFVYVIDAGQKFFTLDFSDQVSTFDATSKKFLDIVNSVNI